MATSPTLRAAATPYPGRPYRAEQTSLTLFPTAARHGNCESAEASQSPPTPDRSEKPAAELVGIARLAASSPCADARRGTEYFLLPVRSILNRCDSDRVPFRWTVNPYRGCEFGCRYCYARYTHEYMELDGGEFERKIYAKENAGELAARDLETEKIWDEHIAIGTATDPYQPAERVFGATRAILERMAEYRGLSVSITTKSDQVLRDLDLLTRIASRSALTVNLSITTLRTRLARLLEPRAPRPDLRLAAVRRLVEAGIAAGIFVMPVLPGLTDSEGDLDSLARAARDVHAKWLSANVLFLMPSSQKLFLPFVAEKFPRLARQYRDWYSRPGYAPESYRRIISERFKSLRRKYRLGDRPVPPEGAAWHTGQLSLGWPVFSEASGRQAATGGLI